ncbi:MAG: DUF4115 domain-containing protein [Thermodesulfovibrionales bacterium]|nr:DUF4115 domain-containing protein [Thermodesulfovibrionales bacterium]
MIGGILKEKRLAKGISLEKVASDLKIKVSFLRAIEEEKFDIFPADVYTIGYIRSYAIYLGLEPEALIEKFKALRIQSSELSAPSPSENKISESKIVSENLSIGEKTPVIKPNLLIVIVIFTILGIVLFSVFKKQKKEILPVPPTSPSVIIAPSENRETSMNLPAPHQEEIQGQAKKEIKNISTSPAKALPSLGNDEGYTLRITAQELTWLKVESEEGTYDITMKPGDSVKYTSRKGFKLTIGNAGGIKLNLNGKDIDSPGKSGEVKIVSLP